MYRMVAYPDLQKAARLTYGESTLRSIADDLSGPIRR
jgi:hypothetical protein